MGIEDLKQEIETARTIIEINKEELDKMSERNQEKIDEIQSEKKGMYTVIKPMNTKQVVVICAVLAGVSFIAGRKEGIQVGLEMSKDINQSIGYRKAMDEVLSKFSEGIVHTSKF